ncbi:hypothetical protein DM50_2834 [Burkholderia mallei]|nr:hypothetical protein DM50_2834 [Burkholderia mallei]
MLAPVPRDLDAARDPHAIVPLDVIEKALQRAKAPRPAEQAAVHADRHHLGRFVAFLVQHVERVAQIVEEMIGGVEALRRRETHVVRVERVRDDQLRHARAARHLDVHPERQIVAVMIGVVQEAAVLGDEPMRVRTVAARIPAERAHARHALDRLHSEPHVLGFVLGRHVLIVNPAPAVTRDLVAELDERARELRMPLDRHADAEHRERQPALVELAQDAPHARARAVFVDRLHAHVARRIRGRADDLGQELLGGGVAVQHAVLAAFLVVEHELHRDARAARPVRLHRMSAVADQIAWIVGIECHDWMRNDAPSAGSRRPREARKPGPRGRCDGWPSVAKTPLSAHTGTRIVHVRRNVCALAEKRRWPARRAARRPIPPPKSLGPPKSLKSLKSLGPLRLLRLPGPLGHRRHPPPPPRARTRRPG